MITLTCENETCKVELQVNGLNIKSNQILRDYGTINKLLGKPYEINCPQCGHTMKKKK